MEDILNFDVGALPRTNAAQPARTRRANAAPGDRPELAAGEPIDIYHWAAVALVTALMCAVLGYAAGTPALARAANVTSLVFGAMGGALMASGVVRSLRARIAAGVPVVETR
ncbi:hypothetical protein AWB76_00279 [Caballeronia temeraria]|uniref:Uncharacterized protein n=1 Tax=Caballeronia temeraria TaxID=1777137 RepID=A0A157Z7G2_9BURK|nr:hypothetical protein [Caballeronia temeraria]SAK41480.1 hypothetical protein AWB76_00279 [Caballeronia temeraria]